ncbi:MAG: CPBP family intramembrane glutamic endopeptidase [Candidatus Limnocylindrales bacterium]
MTDPSDPVVPDADAPGAADAPGTADAPDADVPGAAEAPDVSPAAVDPPRPGIFSLEGRATPGLYLVGWIATVMGLAVLVVSILAAGSAAAPWLFLAGLLVLALGVVAGTGSQAVERGRRTDLAYRGPSPVLMFVVVVPLALIGSLVVLAPLSALGLDAGSPVATTLSLALTTLVYVGVIRLLVVGPGALAWRDMGLVQPAGAAMRDLLVGAAFAVPVLFVTLLLGGVLSRFLEPAPNALPPAGDALGLVFNLLSAAVLAPIGEELFFRGFATTAWAKAVGIGPAVVRGAILFSIAHVLTLLDSSFAEGAQRALFSFVGLLPVGIALGWLFLRRGSLYAAIGLHGAFNGIQLILLFAASTAT